MVPHDTFPADCSLCHVSENWHTLRSDFKFDHLKQTGVPLNGAHAQATCLRCHNDRGPVQKFAAKGCSGCHTDIHRARLGNQCQTCHTELTWVPKDIIARHNRTRFPLTGGHVAVSCTSCHKGAAVGNFEPIDTKCSSCHMADFNRTTSPNHAAAGFTTQCETCHTPLDWHGKFAGHPTSFPLRGGHAALACNACHKPGTFKGLSTACVSCHLKNYQATKDPNHVAAGFATNCESCHNINSWQGAKFNHPPAFPLSAGHANVRCSSCHPGGSFKGAVNDCAACHMKQYTATKNPNHAAVGFSTTCKTCHNTTAWKGAKFSHPSTFPLTNGHAGVACASCHVGGMNVKLNTACVSCHQTKFDQSKNPPHAAAGFGTDCATCHTTVAWAKAKFTHILTFPLTNGHAGQACTACHKGNVYKGLPSNCVSCHQANYDNAKNPNHKTSGFGTDCQTCHNTTIWQGASFKHPATFPLTNGHANKSCSVCHKGGVYTGLSTTCVSCHQANFDQTKNPPHAAAGISTACQTCHTTTAWPGAKFTHTTAFPLTNGHASVACATCHKNNVFKGLPNTCVSCHQAKYDATTKPNHKTSGYGTDCQTCHNTTVWQGASFKHPATFPLTNGHANKSCSACHKGGVYTGLSTACVSCHQAKYDATTSPPHAPAGFSTACQTCHTTTAWPGAKFTHTTAFPLTNGHAGVACTTCHKGNVYKGLPSTCVSCHQAKFDATKSPPHAAAGIGTDCKTCHTTTAWPGAKFTHTASFPLTGGHSLPSCTTCHVGNVFKGLPNACVNCHQARYDATTNPNHKTSGFGTDCKTCHNITTWQGASFKHPATFPLTASHANLACGSCHKGGVYTGLTTACVSCHQAKYNATTAPPHASTGFGTDCQTCHNTTAWLGAKFTHPATFPLTNGHAGKQCSACHKGGVYTGLTTACVSCHQAKYNATTTPPHAAAGFSTACQTCHTTSAWPGAKFTHIASFPLTNGHAGVACATCHKNNVFKGLPNTCVSCHQAKYNATTTPPHAAAGFSTACQTCHTTSAWPGAKFTHIASFPLTGAHGGVACATCHKNNVFKGLPNTCVSCHQAKYTATTTPPHAATGFGTDCQTCHNTTAWLGAKFTHPATFPLTNGHAGKQCSACHKGGVYTGLTTACVSCHQAKYNATTTPPHAAAGFATTCQTCHNTSTWLTANFTHIPSFPLTNGHAGIACATCHKGNVFKGLPNTCVSCHQAKYTATTTPPHAAAGFATTCQTCHNTSTWLTANYTHIASFPLTNGHAGIACATCHKNNVFKGLPNTCVSCHQAKYTATTTPPHAAAGFATTCQTCHGTSTWLTANFTHIASFPLTGGHAGVACATCHKGNVYKGLPSDCASCHINKYNATTNPNHKTAGFGTNCTSCHKGTTTWAGAVFNHTFPITTGTHKIFTCTDCHLTGNQSQFSCTNCHTHAKTTTDSKHRQVRGYTWTSTACLSCHPRG